MFDASEYERPLESVGDIPELCADYMNRIKTTCDEKNIELVLIKYPTCDWNQDKYAVVRKWAEENNIRYLEGILQDIRDGKAHFAEHELLEVE